MFVDDYLAALEAADIQGILSLFAADAVIHSPLYGEMPAREFYPALFADTAESKLTLKTVLHGEHDGKATVAFWFDFNWTLADGSPAPFSVVDIAKLDSDGLITELHIIYDTAPIRTLFEHSRHQARQGDTSAAAKDPS